MTLLVIFYNVCIRIGENIYPAIYKRLSEIENIMARKEN